jgi:hypothetical protein
LIDLNIGNPGVVGENLAVYLKMPYAEAFDKIQICYAALSL